MDLKWRVSLDCGVQLCSRSLVWREGPSTHGKANYYVKFTGSDITLACTLVCYWYLRWVSFSSLEYSPSIAKPMPPHSHLFISCRSMIPPAAWMRAYQCLWKCPSVMRLLIFCWRCRLLAAACIMHPISNDTGGEQDNQQSITDDEGTISWVDIWGLCGDVMSHNVSLMRVSISPLAIENTYTWNFQQIMKSIGDRGSSLLIILIWRRVLIGSGK